MFITVNGKILPCERIDQKYELGVVTDEKVELDLTQVAEQYNRYFNNLKKQCHKCKRVRICNQCIFYLKINNEKPYCTDYMDEEGYNRFVYNQQTWLSMNPGLYKRFMNDFMIY